MLKVESLLFLPSSKERHVVFIKISLYACLFFLAGCGGPTIAPDALARMLKAGTAPPVIDVRSTKEYRSGHIPGAIHVPFTEINTAMSPALLAHCRNGPVVVACEHGLRAMLAADDLRDLGCSEVWLLDGHMARWRTLGFPLIREAP